MPLSCSDSADDHFRGGPCPSGVLSYDAGATPLRAKALGAAITKLARSVGVTATTHTFRRASATELMASGVDVDTSARRLGHTTEVMLGSYVLASDDRAVAAAGTLEKPWRYWFVSTRIPAGL